MRRCEYCGRNRRKGLPRWRSNAGFSRASISRTNFDGGLDARQASIGNERAGKDVSVEGTASTDRATVSALSPAGLGADRRPSIAFSFYRHVGTDGKLAFLGGRTRERFSGGTGTMMGLGDCFHSGVLLVRWWVCMTSSWRCPAAAFSPAIDVVAAGGHLARAVEAFGFHGVGMVSLQF